MSKSPIKDPKNKVGLNNNALFLTTRFRFFVLPREFFFSFLMMTA